MQRLFPLLIGLLLLSACGGVDIAFVNQVKLFEPRWIDLSEKFSYIERNMKLTEKRYPQDLKQVEALFETVGADQRIELINLRNQYREVVQERLKLLDDYDKTRQQFSNTVHEFNDWENKLMQNDLDEEVAKMDFIKYQNDHQELMKQVDGLQTRLIQNIERHNSILRSMTQILRVYTNYDLNPR
jgi:chromosome segregation ATPase